MCKQRVHNLWLLVGMTLRKRLLCAQPEQLQGRPGKCGDFGRVHPTDSFQGGFWEKPWNTCLEQELQNCFRPVAANTLSLKHSEHSRVATSPHRQHSLGPARETELRGSVSSRSHLKSSLSCPNWCSKEEESHPREPRGGCSQPIIHHSLSSSKSVISSSKEGMILLNILYSFPKRGIWIMKQDGIWGKKKRKESPSQKSQIPEIFL